MKSAVVLLPGLNRDRDMIAAAPTAEDTNGVANRKVALMRLRSKLSHFWYNDNIQKPTHEELEEARHHAEHELAQHTGPGHELEEQRADGHQYDGRNAIEGDELRKH